MKHFLSIKDLKATEAMELVLRAKEMKDGDFRSTLLAGKTLAMIFEKASTRTRVSFEVGIRHLGGDTIFMTPADSQLGRSEPLSDTARVLSRYGWSACRPVPKSAKASRTASKSSLPSALFRQ